MNSEYQKTLDWLFEQFPSYQLIGSKAYKPTLENTKKLLVVFDHPEQNLKFIHVAGSNGKGSVSSMIASTLTESDFKVGLFTSPHIKDFSERIRINGMVIPEEFVISFVNRLKSINLDFSPSFFEITFILALIYFNENKCDYCIIETGLGGRLDATNVITPILSVITSISLEHTNILGNTLAEIAVEKGGIIKQNVPVVIGPIHQECEAVLINQAINMNAPVFRLSGSIPIEIEKRLIADYQAENLRTAMAALKFLNPNFKDQVIERGFINLKRNTGFYGRLEIIETKPLIIYDVSHNVDGIRSTIKAVLQLTKGKLHIIYGSSSDKNIEEISKIMPTYGIYYLTEFKGERSAKLRELKEIFGRTPLKSAGYFDEPESALIEAKNNAAESDTILVIGSFFLIEHFF